MGGVTIDRIHLFDVENWKRKIKLNPIKYDKQGLLSVFREAKGIGLDSIIIDINLYTADTWVFEYLGIKEEDGRSAYIFDISSKKFESFLEENKDVIFNKPTEYPLTLPIEQLANRCK